MDNCNISNANQTIEDAQNWMWLNISICNSTKQDLIATLGEPKSIRAWPGEGDQHLTDNYHYDLDDHPIFWIKGNKVVGIGFSASKSQFQTEDLPETVSEVKRLYGRPELVGWSIYGSVYRTVVWSSKGVLVEVRVDDDRDQSRISNIVYFSPMAEDEFINSPWSRFVLDSRPNSDYVDFLPQDPFDW